MPAIAKKLDARLLSGPAAEITGPDEMYVPTTQICIEPDGSWHRRSAVPIETACGLEYAAALVREYELSGDLCKQCFTPRERWLAEHPDEIDDDRERTEP
ncbi:MAG TPA: hypothetical protein VGF94_08100 [Kofleriaceae bacterium]|jgi:hypothetical protein